MKYLTTCLVCTVLMLFSCLATAQDRDQVDELARDPGNLGSRSTTQDALLTERHAEVLRMEITSLEAELAEVTDHYGNQHPEIKQRQAQLSRLQTELESLLNAYRENSLIRERAQAIATLNQQMQQFGDTMERLNKQMRAFEDLEKQLKTEKLPSRDDFFKSAEHMFFASKQYYQDLDEFLVDELAESRRESDMEQMQKVIEVEQLARLQELKALKTQLDVSEAQLQAQQEALAMQAAQASHQRAENALRVRNNSQTSRMDRMEARLMRIELMLEKIAAGSNSGNDGPEKQDP